MRRLVLDTVHVRFMATVKLSRKIGGGYKFYPNEVFEFERVSMTTFAWQPILGGPRYLLRLDPSTYEVVEISKN